MIFHIPIADTNLICAFSHRHHRNMSLFYGDAKESLNNRKNFLSPLGIDYRSLICAKQIHASSVKYVKEEGKGKGALSYDTSIDDTDALVADKKNLPLAVFTADCLSIFLYDSLTPAIGLIHAGRQGTKENIASCVIQLMQKQFNTKTKELHIGFGPAIRSCCYEVTSELNDFFPYNLIKRDNRYYLDLIQINKNELLDLGVKENNIFDSSICTSCRNKEFFSYRKEGNTCGRTMSVIMLK